MSHSEEKAIALETKKQTEALAKPLAEVVRDKSSLSADAEKALAVCAWGVVPSGVGAIKKNPLIQSLPTDGFKPTVIRVLSIEEFNRLAREDLQPNTVYVTNALENPETSPNKALYYQTVLPSGDYCRGCLTAKQVGFSLDTYKTQEEVEPIATPIVNALLMKGHSPLHPFENCSRLLANLMSSDVGIQEQALREVKALDAPKLLFLIAQLNVLAPAGWAVTPSNVDLVQSQELLFISKDFALSSTVKQSLWHCLKAFHLTHMMSGDLGAGEIIVSTFHGHLSATGGLSVADNLEFQGEDRHQTPEYPCAPLAATTFDSGVLPSGTNDAEFSEHFIHTNSLTADHNFKVPSAPLLVSVEKLTELRSTLDDSGSAERSFGKFLISLAEELASQYKTFRDSASAEADKAFLQNLDNTIARLAFWKEKARYILPVDANGDYTVATALRNDMDMPLVDAMEHASCALSEIRHRMMAFRVVAQSKEAYKAPIVTERSLSDIEKEKITHEIATGLGEDEAKRLAALAQKSIERQMGLSEDDTKEQINKLGDIASILFADDETQGRIIIHYQGDTESICHEGMNRSQTQAAMYDVLKLPSSTGQIKVQGAESGYAPDKSFADITGDNVFGYLHGRILGMSNPGECLSRNFYNAFGTTKRVREGHLSSIHSPLNPPDYRAFSEESDSFTLEKARQQTRDVYQAACETVLKNALDRRHQSISLYMRAGSVIPRYLVDAADRLQLTPMQRTVVKQYLHVSFLKLPDNISRAGGKDERDVSIKRRSDSPEIQANKFEPQEGELRHLTILGTKAYLSTGDQYSRMFVMDAESLGEAEALYQASATPAAQAVVANPIEDARVGGWARTLLRVVKREYEYWMAGCPTLPEGIEKRRLEMGPLMERASFLQQFKDAMQNRQRSLRALPEPFASSDDVIRAGLACEELLQQIVPAALTAAPRSIEEVLPTSVAVAAPKPLEPIRIGALFSAKELKLIQDASDLYDRWLAEYSNVKACVDDYFDRNHPSSEMIKSITSQMYHMVVQLSFLEAKVGGNPLLDKALMNLATLHTTLIETSERRQTAQAELERQVQLEQERQAQVVRPAPVEPGLLTQSPLATALSVPRQSMFSTPNNGLPRIVRAPGKESGHLPKQAMLPAMSVELTSALETVKTAAQGLKNHAIVLCKRGVMANWNSTFVSRFPTFSGVKTQEGVLALVDRFADENFSNLVELLAATYDSDHNFVASATALRICNSVQAILKVPTKDKVVSLQKTVVDYAPNKTTLDHFRPLHTGVFGCLLLALANLLRVFHLLPQHTTSELHRQALSDAVQNLSEQLMPAGEATLPEHADLSEPFDNTGSSPSAFS